MPHYSKLSSNIIHDVSQMYRNNGGIRFYHNWEHVERCYFHALNTFNFPYDKELDWAIAFHDCVYDDKPDKELRSAQALERYRSFGGAPTKASELILSTTNHVPYPDPRMVLVDLADFMDKKTADANFEKVLRENLCLYPNVPIREVLRQMVRYQTMLFERIKPFEVKSQENKYWRHFVMINSGISESIKSINEMRADLNA